MLQPRLAVNTKRIINPQLLLSDELIRQRQREAGESGEHHMGVSVNLYILPKSGRGRELFL